MEEVAVGGGTGGTKVKKAKSTQPGDRQQMAGAAERVVGCHRFQVGQMSRRRCHC